MFPIIKESSDESKQLDDELLATGDPRVAGGGEKFDTYPYTGRAPIFPGSGTPVRKLQNQE